MADSPKVQALWPLFPLLVFFLVIGGYIQLRPTLDSPRPQGETAALEEKPVAGVVPARLWQDPLATIAAHAPPLAEGPGTKDPKSPNSQSRDTTPTAAPAPADESRTPKDRLAFPSGAIVGSLPPVAANDGPKIVALLVMVDGSPYPEATESRLRARRAVLGALEAEDFTPHDAEHLHYFTFTPPRATDAETKNGPKAPANRPRSFHVPYEWYGPATIRAGASAKDENWALVVWINESAVPGAPVATLEALAEGLRDVMAPRSFEARVLGPSNSDRLRSMAFRSSQVPGANNPGASARADGGNLLTLSSHDRALQKIYSSQSTAEGARQAAGAGPSPGPVTEVEGVPIAFTIGEDRELAEALGHELHQRRSCAGRGGGGVALIAEWDTLYGREIVRVFDEVLSACPNCGATVIKHYTYDRGLDGRPPAGGGTGAAQTTEDAAGGAFWRDPLPGRAGTHVPATGPSQLDSLRRTIQAMRRDDPHWAAIGVVGSDVYDKILLVRVLRYYFPSAILFTTDLDARLLDPAESQSTHNLLIASHYGLRLRDELQRKVPPFRSVYDTSQFLATLSAIWDARKRPNHTEHTIAFPPPPGTREKKLTLDLRPPPIVFEVGRTGPFPVQVPNSKIPSAETVHPTTFQRSIWPWSPPERRPAIALALAYLFGAATLAIVAWLAWPAGDDGPNDPNQLPGPGQEPKRKGASSSRILENWTRWTFSGGAALALALVALTVSDHFSPDGEPFQLFDGISTWPSEYMRLVTLVFAVWALGRGARRLKTIWGRAEQLLADPAGPARVPIEQGEPSARAARVGLLALAYFAFGAFLVLALGPLNRPVRGAVNNAVDLGLTIASVAATVAFLAFVIDATLLCERFVRSLSRLAPRDWASPELEKWSEALGFPKGPGAAESGQPPSPGAMTEEARAAVGNVLCVRAIAQLTQPHGELIINLAVAYVLMFLARDRGFDNWDWPPALVALFAIAATVVVGCGVSLRMTARRAQKGALGNLEELEFEARRRAGGQADGPLVRAVQAAVAKVQAEKGGAFSPFYADPVLQAVLVPLAGLVSLLPLLDRIFGVSP